MKRMVSNSISLAGNKVVFSQNDNVSEKKWETDKSSIVFSAVEAAKSACKNAYCPYSKFPVGAAVITEDGEVFSGCNVENASYGLTICAERNALFQAIAKGKKEVKFVVIFTPTSTSTTPCGACRQVINEFGPKATILSVCNSNDRFEEHLNELLKKAFGPHNLK